MANLYGAYRGAGKAGGAYASSLQDVMNVGHQKEASRQSYEIQQEESDRIFGAIQQGIGLFSSAMGAKAGQEEAAGQISEATGGKAVQTVGETKIWDILRGKAEYGKGETAWGEAAERIGTLFGDKQREWTLEEEVGGIEAGTYTQSDLLTRAKVSKYEKMGLDLSGKSKIDLFDDDNSDDERWPRNEDTYDPNKVPTVKDAISNLGLEDEYKASEGRREESSNAYDKLLSGVDYSQADASRKNYLNKEEYGPQEEEPWRNWTLGGL